jgi:hypothetical protein
MSEITFYNRQGGPTCYAIDDGHIYLFNGQPVAYFYEDSLYSYEGTHLGRYSNGWIRDNNGQCVFFNSDAKGGPIKPIKGIEPIKGIKGIKPIKGIKQIKPIKPIDSLSWSELSNDNFFFQ